MSARADKTLPSKLAIKILGYKNQKFISIGMGNKNNGMKVAMLLWVEPLHKMK